MNVAGILLTFLLLVAVGAIFFVSWGDPTSL